MGILFRTCSWRQFWPHQPFRGSNPLEIITVLTVTILQIIASGHTAPLMESNVPGEIDVRSATVTSRLFGLRILRPETESRKEYRSFATNTAFGGPVAAGRFT